MDHDLSYRDIFAFVRMAQSALLAAQQAVGRRPNRVLVMPVVVLGPSLPCVCGLAVSKTAVSDIVD